MIKTAKNKLFFDWVILISALILAVCISLFENLQPLFLALLILEIVLVLVLKSNASLNVLTLGRMLLGGLFIFSGLVKSIDPVGTQYRIEDYFIAFGTDWAIPFALPLSILLNASEFLIGILLFFNIRLRLTIWLVMIMMLFFTFLTLNDAINNPVPDCGCFGDALLISNWQTFYKNLVIDAVLLMILLQRNQIPSWFSPKNELLIFSIFLLGIVYFEVYNIRHLPVMDFRAWKVGNRMSVENPKPKQYYLTYLNTRSGDTTEYLSPDYPYDDSIWASQNEFISQRVVNPNPPLHDLSLEDEYGNNSTAALIENPSYQFLMVSYDLEKIHVKDMSKIRDFIRDCNEKEISFALITASLPDIANNFINTYQLDTPVYFADDIALKVMIRANPGLVLLHDSKVIDKWHSNDWPDLDEIDALRPVHKED